MTNWKTFSGSLVFATLMGSTASFAAVTSAEVWADWKTQMDSYGYQMTYNEAMSGDILNISDFKIVLDLPEGEGKITMTYGGFGFQDQSDGTVAILIPDLLPLSVSGDEFSVTVNFNQAGNKAMVSGDAAEMTYDYSAPEISISIADLIIEGDKVDDAVLNIAMKNLTSKSVRTTGDLMSMVGNFSADMLTYDFSVAEPREGGFKMSANGHLASIAGDTTSMIPKGISMQDMPKALAAGMAMAANFTYGESAGEFSSSDRGNSTSGTSTGASGVLNFAMNQNHIQYGGTALETKASIMSSEIPLPSIDYELGEAVFNLMMPIAKTESPSDFALEIKLGDLSVNDQIWGMIDPSAALPHDPATVHMDFAGKANWLIDIMEPDAEENMDVDMPGELHELTLKRLQVKVAGADLTGAGAFTFDNTDLVTFDGLPKPTGAVDLKLVGGNGLMDNLVKMGLLPEDQAMGARMMMGLFAVVGEGDDTLTSKIEVNDEGHVLANGQRLK